MFAIAVPSTLELTTPSDKEDGEPKRFASLDFFHPSDDVSKCRVRLTTADGDVHEATFNTQGGVVDRYFENEETREAARAAAEKAEEDAAAEQKRQQDEAAAQQERELTTADDTTAADVANDAPKYQPEPAHG